MAGLRRFQLNRQAKETFVEQIYVFIVNAIENAEIAYSSKIPSIRDFATQLSCNKNAVVSAYDRLIAGGYIVSKPGSGYFVARKPTLGQVQSSSWGAQSPHAMSNVEKLRYALVSARDANHKPIISLGGAHLPPEAIPLTHFRSINRTILSESSPYPFTYEDPQGLLSLRENISSHLQHRGIPVRSSQEIVVTNGMVHGINMLLSYFTKEGDTVIVEQPTTPFVIEIVNRRRLNPIFIERHGDTVVFPEENEEIFRLQPKVIITQPSFQNPTGSTMSSVMRHELIRMASKLGAKIIELDPVWSLAFEDFVPPPVSALDGLQNTFYVCSYSTSIAPSMRLGYVVGEQSVVEEIAKCRMTMDVCSPFLEQAMVCEFLKSGKFKKHVQKQKEQYRHNRDILNTMLKKLAPKEIQWNIPDGGIFLWLKAVQGASFTDLFPIALERGVAIAPGDLFYFSCDYRMEMRINFAAFHPVQTWNALNTVFQLWKHKTRTNCSIPGY